ncbi:MAG: hypothetical protein KGH58_00065 [Candidatus Micrarchaeota archaeon]|nr:hypothetical protein [Candidatus Micrarchaeota archaeon]
MKTKLSILLIALTLSVFIGTQAFAATPTNIVCTGTELSGPGTLTCGTLPGNTISNSIIDVGQYTFITINGISGGNSPYLANWVFNAPNVPKANTINFLLNATNNIVLGVNAFSNTQLTLTSNTAGTQISNTVTATTITGAWAFNAFISEVMGTNTFKTTSIPAVTINKQPTMNVIIYAPNGVATNSIPFGSGLISINAVVSGGSGTFTFNWFVNNGVSVGPVPNTLIGTAETFNTVNMIAQAQNNGGISSGNFIYTINAFDSGTSTPYTLAAVTNTLVITKNSVLTASCTSPGFVGYYTWSTVTCTGTATLNNQSSWSLYVDGVLMNQTASVANWTQETQSGLHTILFKNAGNSNYTNFTTSTTLKVGSLGTGGTAAGGAPSITTTAATTVPTTVTTTVAPSILNKSGVVTVKISRSSPGMVNVSSMGASLVVNAAGQGTANVNVTVSNVTASTPAAPNGLIKLVAFNVSANATTVSNITVNFPFLCSWVHNVPTPYVLKNGTWMAVANYTANSTSCVLTFTIPKDPVVGIMHTNETAAPTTTIAPTTVAATTSVAATTVQQAAQQPTTGSGIAAAAIVVVIIVIIIAAYALTRKKRR